jgi:type I restriction enzyme, S subunit
MTGKQLKDSILQFAIEGKLVPQDPCDEPASELVKKVRIEKERLIKAGKLKKDKDDSCIYKGSDGSYYEKFSSSGEKLCIDNEIPFEVPSSWTWIRLYYVSDIARGGSPRPIKDYITNIADGINWIKIGDTEKGGKYINKTKEKISVAGVSKSRMVHKGDFLLTNSMSYGRPYITNINGCIHDGWLVISPLQNSYYQDFLYYLLSSAFAYVQFSGKVSGAVVKNLNSDKVSHAIFPIPPINEQRRISLVLDSIMPKVYDYGKLQEERTNLNDTIYSKLCKSLLQSAIQGKLVTSSSSDKEVPVSLNRIKEDKKRISGIDTKEYTKNESIIYKDSDNSYYEKIGEKKYCIDDEIPFPIPDKWTWIRLGYIGDIYTGNSINKEEKQKKYLQNFQGHCYLGTKDIGFDHCINYRTGITIPIEDKVFKIAPAGSILMCIEGGSAGKKVAITEIDVCFGNKLCCIPKNDMVFNKYIYYFLQSELFIKTFRDNISGIIGGVSINKIKFLLVPLPPFLEQKNIAKKIEILFQCLKRY